MLFVWQHYGGKAGFEDAAREQAFGDYSANRFAWKLTDVKRVPHPFPCKGALGLWSVPQIVLDLIAGQGVL